MPSATAAKGGAGGPLALEFATDPATAARLPRHPVIARARLGRARGQAEELIWLDTPDGALAGRGVALQQDRRGERRLLHILPAAGAPWLPGTLPPDAAAEEDGATAPGNDAAALRPVAAFSGRRATLSLAAGRDAAPLRLVLLTGRLRAVAAERPVARLILSGAPEPVLSLARALAAELPLLPPSAALAEEGRALAHGEVAPRPRRRGPPDLGGAETVEAALLAALGHLLEVMLHQAPLCRVEAGPEGVHQMRVALRRLRTALKAFRPATRCATVEEFEAGLKALAGRLGEARDLDVFLDGIGARVAEAFPGEKRIAALLKAVEARRAAAYRALRAEALDAPDFRLLALDGMALLLRRPWREETEGAPERTALLDQPLRCFAARLLDKRWRRLRAHGEAIATLAPEALHALRLEAKRLRYTAELFVALWPGKPARRLLKRLAALQDALGMANDAAVARVLVAALPPPVPAWAVGAVEGFALADSAGARRRIQESWEDLMDAKPFWSTV